MAKGGKHLFFTVLCAITLTLSAARQHHSYEDNFTLQSFKAKTVFNEALESYLADTQRRSEARKSLSSQLEATDDTSCVHVLQNLTNYFLVYNETVERILRFSGKDYNDLGRYYDCIDSKDFRYILATIPKALPIPVSIGICIPDVCTVADFNNFKSYVVQALNSILPEFFEGVKGFTRNSQQIITNDDLKFEESQKRNNEVTQADAGGWLIVLVIFFSVFIAIFSSVATWFYKKEGAKKAAEKREKNRQRRQSSAVQAATSLEHVIDNGVGDSPAQSAKPKRRKRVIKQSSFEKMISACSFQRSLSKIFAPRITDQDDEEFAIFDGLRVVATFVIILGNTYFYILKGAALQNMTIIQQWMGDFIFSAVLSAEHVVDCFFWLTAFLGVYFMLKKLQRQDGVQDNTAFIYLNRAVRLLPLYFFAIMFFWKFLVIFGGDGPLFYMYETTTQCSNHWLWHLTFLNNLIPWATADTCLPWTWYLANDFQFFLLLPIFAGLYYDAAKRQKCFYVLVGLLAVNTLIQLIVILANSLSVSYFTYNDEYWTIYYVKPYSRLPVFLLGVIAGCSYFTFKREQEETIEGHKIAKIIQALQHSGVRSVASTIIGYFIMFLMCGILQHINNTPNNVNEFGNMLYLLIHRPLFIAGFTMVVFPILVADPGTPLRLMKQFLSHSFWTPFSRLTYGALLSHGIWMQFREFNNERGTWASGLDAFLFFLAYVTFSFLFSFVTALIWEQPIASMWEDFVLKPRHQSQAADALYLAQSTKNNKMKESNDVNVSVTSNRESTSSIQEIIQSKKRQLLMDSSQDEMDEEDEIGNYSLQRQQTRKRKTSEDTEDLEDSKK